MHSIHSISAALVFALAACSQAEDPESATTAPQTPPQAAPQVEPQAAPPAGGVDASALLAALSLAPDAQGQVVNECGEKVTPSILAAELGGAVGTAQLVAIGGGPNTAACYGDGPDLHLLRRDGASHREIYSARGRVLVILPSSHDGVRDLADGGPGSSFPVWEWNGSAYSDAGRAIADSELGDAVFLP